MSYKLYGMEWIASQYHFIIIELIGAKQHENENKNKVNLIFTNARNPLQKKRQTHTIHRNRKMKIKSKSHII